MKPLVAHLVRIPKDENLPLLHWAIDGLPRLNGKRQRKFFRTKEAAARFLSMRSSACHLKGSTFQWYPWALAACEMLKRDTHLPSDQRNTVTREFDELATKWLQEFHADLLSGSAETYTIAESICAVSLARQLKPAE